MKRVLVLSSYGYSWEGAEDTTTCRGFLRALADHGWRRGDDLEVVIHHTARQADHREWLLQRLARRDEPVDLVYTGSASLMEVAREVLRGTGRTLPLLYWGSHIVDQGRVINAIPTEPFIAGLELAMPLYIHHRQFRLLRELLPDLQEIYTPFSVASAFYHPAMERRHRRAVERFGEDCWVDAAGEYGGFPGLGNLAEIIGARFFEHPCTDAETLVAAVERLPRQDGPNPTRVLLNGIECFHIPGANEALVEAADRRGIPYIGLNFGSFHSERGPLAVFTNDIDAAAYGVGDLAARVLAGAPPASFGVRRRDTFRFMYNQPNADRRNIAITPLALDRIARFFGPLARHREGLDAGSHAHDRPSVRLDPEDPGGSGGSEGQHL